MARVDGRAQPRSEKVLIDTGVLVAVYARDDPYHDAATRWLAGFQGSLRTVEPVLAETSFFLPARSRAAVAELVERGIIRISAATLGLDSCFAST